MITHITISQPSKKILSFVAFGSVCAIGMANVNAATKTWTNSTGNNVWTTATNWDPINQPTTSDLARILNAGSLNTTILLRPSGSSGSVDVGTLSLESDTYQDLVAGASEATLNFGSHPRIDVSRGTSANSYGIGYGSGTTIFVLPSSTMLDIRVASAESLALNPAISGAASLSFTRLSGSGQGTVLIGNLGTIFTGASTFSGGSALGADMTLIVAQHSSQSGSGAAVSNGPLGTGTLTMAGGTLMLAHSNSASLELGNAIQLTANSSLHTDGSQSSDIRALVGTVNLSNSPGGTLTGRRLTVSTFARAQFKDAVFNSTDIGTITVASDSSVDFAVNGGTITSRFGGAVGELFAEEEAMVIGEVFKIGTGAFEAKHFRVYDLHVDGGTLRTYASGSGTLDPVGSTDGTGRCGSLTLAGGDAPTVKFDLQNNDFIVDWKGQTSPIGTITNSGTGVTGTSGFAAQLRAAYNGGAWTGDGITSGLANSGTYAIAYAEAKTLYNLSDTGTATFSGQTVDSTTVVFMFSRYGDIDLDGLTNFNDFGIWGPNYQSSGLWQKGDFDYNGFVDLGDFALLSANLNATPDLGRATPADLILTDLGRVYMALLQNPPLYWDARDWTEFWQQYYAVFDDMELGPIPPRPQARIPEPYSAAMAAALWAFWTLRWRSRSAHRTCAMQTTRR